MNVTVSEQAEGVRWFVRFNDLTPRGEKLLVEITLCKADPKDKQALPYVAKKLGWTDRVIPEWWSIQTFITDAEGNQWGDMYNPTVTMEEYEYPDDGIKHETRYSPVIDFDWHLEATEENARKLLEEIERRAFES